MRLLLYMERKKAGHRTPGCGLRNNQMGIATEPESKPKE